MNLERINVGRGLTAVRAVCCEVVGLSKLDSFPQIQETGSVSLRINSRLNEFQNGNAIDFRSVLRAT
jgi:hypothetical protein